MNKTQIEWVRNPAPEGFKDDNRGMRHAPDGKYASDQGYTWNPITGCLNGCEYCYAGKLANTRLRERYLANKHIPNSLLRSGFDTFKALDDPFYPRFWPERLHQPIGYITTEQVEGVLTANPPKGKGIFACDMSDLFGIGIPEEWTRKVLRVMAQTSYNRYYLLTKQPQNLKKFSPFPDNCWVGVTATNQEMFYEACYAIKNIKAKLKYLSLEPLLNFEPLPEVLTWPHWIRDWLRTGGINWVIIGAQSKPTVMPKIEWVKEIVGACDKAGTQVFLKDNLSSLIPINSPLRYGPAGELRLRQEMPSIKI